MDTTKYINDVEDKNEGAAMEETEEDVAVNDMDAPTTRGLGVQVRSQQAMGPVSTVDYQGEINSSYVPEAVPGQKSGFDMMASTQAIQSVSLQDELSKLKDEPIYYEKYTSFQTHHHNYLQNPSLLLDTCNQIFSENIDVDHSYAKNKFKVNGVTYENFGRSTFRVKLFKSKQNGILCEFQRRSGCVVSFSKLYKRVLSRLPVEAVGELKGQAQRWVDFNEKIEQTSMTEPTVQLDDATASNLIAMAGCDSIDVQREGAQALASVAHTPGNRGKLVEMAQDVMQLFEKLLGSVDVELCTSGAEFLAHMTEEKGFMEQINKNPPFVSSLLEKIQSILTSGPSFETERAKRQSAFALSRISLNPEMALAIEGVEGIRDLIFNLNPQNDYPGKPLQAIQQNIARARRSVNLKR